MYSFIINRQPISYNSWLKPKTSKTKKEGYKKEIKSSFEKFYPAAEKYENALYGIVYHFFIKDVDTDADNISKPIWDCLEGVIFDNDKQVKLRIAVSFDLASNDFSDLNVSGIRSDIIDALNIAIDNREEHFLYIECGLLHNSMFSLNLEKHGN